MATKITVDKSAYVRSHGRQPKGRGLWLFAIDGETDVLKCFGHTGTLTEGIAAARKVARKTITVMP